MGGLVQQSATSRSLRIQATDRVRDLVRAGRPDQSGRLTQPTSLYRTRGGSHRQDHRVAGRADRPTLDASPTNARLTTTQPTGRPTADRQRTMRRSTRLNVYGAPSRHGTHTSLRVG